MILYLSSLVRTWDNQVTSPSLAIDVGCGSGQCTELLAPFYHQVIGYDVSETQIEEATANNELNNVKYVVSSAEKLALTDSSVDLITCCQSFHWFDAQLFLKEAERLLKPGGVLALIAQEVPDVSKDGASPQLSGLCKRLRDEFKLGKLNEFWKSEANRIEDGYSDVNLSFNYVIRKTFVHTVPGTGYDVIGFLDSWSCVQTMRRKNPQLAEKIFNDLKTELAQCCACTVDEVESTEMALVYHYGVLIGRK